MGLRSSDILNINKKTLDFKNKTLRYYSPKHKKFREIAFHNDLAGILKKAIKQRTNKKLVEYN